MIKYMDFITMKSLQAHTQKSVGSAEIISIETVITPNNNPPGNYTLHYRVWYRGVL